MSRLGFYTNATDNKTHVPLLPQCGVCKLNLQCQSPKMQVSGRGRRKVMILGEFPDRQEDLQNRPLVGESGQYLAKVLRKLGVDMREDCWLVNSLRCHPAGNKIKDDKSISWCRPFLVNDFNRLNPDVIIALGGMAAKSVIGWVWKEDVGGIERWVGFQIPSQKINAWICPTFHPSFLLRSQAKVQDDFVMERMFEAHLQAAFELEGKPWKRVPDYASKVRVVYDHKEAAKLIKGLSHVAHPVSFDFETDRIKPDHSNSRILCCSISNGKDAIAYPWYGSAIQATSEFLRSDVPKVGWSIKFETRWTRRILGHGVRNWVWDGMLAAHILDNRPGVTSLKFQAFINLGIDAYDDYVKLFMKSPGSNTPNRLHDADLHKLLTYCGIDSLLEHKVAQIQSQQMGVTL